LYESLKRVPEGLEVYKREDIPEDWQYKNNPLVLPLVVVAKPGFAFIRSNETSPAEQGQHGYDSSMPDMRSIFYARGPGTFQVKLDLNFESM